MQLYWLTGRSTDGGSTGSKPTGPKPTGPNRSELVPFKHKLPPATDSIHCPLFHPPPPRLFAYPQIELFSFGRVLDISPRLSPPAARCPTLPAAGPCSVLLVGWWCCSNWLLYNPLLQASETFISLDGKWYLCMNVSAFKICNFFFF